MPSSRRALPRPKILARWGDIVGPEVAAHSEPIKINWPRALGDEPPGTGHAGAAGGRPRGARDPAFVGGDPGAGHRFFGWQAIGSIALRQAPLRRREPATLPPPPDPAIAARIATDMPEVVDEDLRQALARLGAAIKRK